MRNIKFLIFYLKVNNLGGITSSSFSLKTLYNNSIFSVISSPVQAAEDVNVTFEDQQKINKFARNTSRITELKEEIEVKKVPLLSTDMSLGALSLSLMQLRIGVQICSRGWRAL